MEEMIALEIDGKEVKAKEGMTILEAARGANIEIPTLCYHEKLKPYGACRICSVEAERGGRVRIVAACGYPVEGGLLVRTRSPKIDRIRKVIIELVAPLAMSDGGISGELRRLADEYGADIHRFESRLQVEPTRCILCGLCVRYCDEVMGGHAIGFMGRGIERRVVFFPERASRFCPTCHECYEVCPTGKIAAETDGSIFPKFSIDDFLSGKM